MGVTIWMFRSGSRGPTHFGRFSIRTLHPRCAAKASMAAAARAAAVRAAAAAARAAVRAAAVRDVVVRC